VGHERTQTERRVPEPRGSLPGARQFPSEQGLAPERQASPRTDLETAQRLGHSFRDVGVEQGTGPARSAPASGQELAHIELRANPIAEGVQQSLARSRLAAATLRTIKATKRLTESAAQIARAPSPVRRPEPESMSPAGSEPWRQAVETGARQLEQDYRPSFLDHLFGNVTSTVFVQLNQVFPHAKWEVSTGLSGAEDVAPQQSEEIQRLEFALHRAIFEDRNIPPEAGYEWFRDYQIRIQGLLNRLFPALRWTVLMDYRGYGGMETTRQIPRDLDDFRRTVQTQLNGLYEGFHGWEVSAESSGSALASSDPERPARIEQALFGTDGIFFWILHEKPKAERDYKTLTAFQLELQRRLNKSFSELAWNVRLNLMQQGQTAPSANIPVELDYQRWRIERHLNLVFTDFGLSQIFQWKVMAESASKLPDEWPGISDSDELELMACINRQYGLIRRMAQSQAEEHEAVRNFQSELQGRLQKLIPEVRWAVLLNWWKTSQKPTPTVPADFDYVSSHLERMLNQVFHTTGQFEVLVEATGAEAHSFDPERRELLHQKLDEEFVPAILGWKRLIYQSPGSGQPSSHTPRGLVKGLKAG
jgi:hypothetical protein